MLNEPRTYRHSTLQVVFTLVVLGIVAGMSLLASDRDTVLIFLPFVFLLLLVALYSLYAMTARVVISENEITIQNLLGSKSLNWSEISRVSGRQYGIKLHNFDGDVALGPSPQLPGYEEIIEWIGAKRPDLFAPPESEEISRSWYVIILIAATFVFLAGAGIFFIIQTGEWLMSIFFLIVGAAILAVVMASPQSIRIQGRQLFLKYIFSQKTLAADEIRSIQFVSYRTRNGKNYRIELDLAGNQKVKISSLQPSLPIAYLMLKNWHKKFS